MYLNSEPDAVTSIHWSMNPSPNSTSVPVTTTLPVTEGVETAMQCIVVGGSPPPNIDIFLDQVNITNLFTLSRLVLNMTESKDNDVTSMRSTSSFIAQVHNSGQVMQCIAQVNSLEPVSTKVMLQVVRQQNQAC